MLAERIFHLLIVDDDRYFCDGLIKLIQDRYPGMVLKQEIQDMNEIDYLLISSNDSSPATMKILSKQMSEKSKVVLINGKTGTREECRNFNQGNLISQLSKNVTSREIGNLMNSIVPKNDKKTQQITLYLATAAHTDAILQNLTPQENQTLKYMRYEFSLTQIAYRLRLSPKTVSHYKRSIMTKLGYKKNIELYDWLRSF